MRQILYCVYEKEKEELFMKKNWDCITGVYITGADGSSGAGR